MKRRIHLPLKAFSINRMSSRDSRYKTKEFKEWTYQVFHHLNNSKHQKAFEELRNEFDEKKHAYCIELTAYYPEKDLITKANVLSARAFDTTNIEKPLIDLLFGPDFHKKKSPYGCKNLNIDDKYLLDCNSKKRIGAEHSLDIIIQIVDRDEILERHVVDNKG